MDRISFFYPLSKKKKLNNKIEPKTHTYVFKMQISQSVYQLVTHDLYQSHLCFMSVRDLVSLFRPNHGLLRL